MDVDVENQPKDLRLVAQLSRIGAEIPPERWAKIEAQIDRLMESKLSARDLSRIARILQDRESSRLTALCKLQRSGGETACDEQRVWLEVANTVRKVLDEKAERERAEPEDEPPMGLVRVRGGLYECRCLPTGSQPTPTN